jgi:hypothetical protein
VLLGCVEPLPMSLGTKLCSLLISNDPVLVFLWLFVIWVSSLFFSSSSSISFSQLLCVGVDNALIKGEIANIRLICALVVWICDE